MRIEVKTLISCFTLVCRPVVKFCIQHGLKVQDLLETCKALFVELSEAELKRQKFKATDSALSVMTGLHRRDIVRFREGAASLSKADDTVSKVLGQWQNDKKFCDAKGNPRALSYGTEQSEFSKLVYLVSKDVAASTLLAELERSGLACKKENALHLLNAVYVPKGQPVNTFKILAADTHDLQQAVSENCFLEPTTPNMHFRTMYDRVNPQALPEIRSWLLKEGQALHVRAREFLSKYDLDITPSAEATDETVRVVLSSFSLVEKNTKEE